MVRGGTPPGMPPTSSPLGEPRHISEDDKAAWLEAASKRTPPRERDRETLRNYLQARNRLKWYRLQGLLRWYEKEMKKLGLNPEDARWIL
jgi:hypothetical protein